jgi:DNA ligase (NAD+)
MANIDWQEAMMYTMGADWPTDGLVISLKDQEYGATLGGTSHHPFHSIALKYGNPTGETKLIDVIWQVGKRKITPVGIVEPVMIEGYTNTRISLHNFDGTKNLKIGDEITIQRCGQVIPQLKSVDKTFKSSKEITCEFCPACGTATVYEHPNLICPNEVCGGMIAKRLHDSLVRLNVENVGPATCSDLVENGHKYISGVLEMRVQDWERLPGYADKSAKLRYRAMQQVRVTPVEDFRVLASLNIEGVGLTLGAKLCGKMTLPEIEACEDFTHLDGVGKITSDKLVEGLVHYFPTLRWMKQNFIIKETKGLADRPLICFTGKSEISRDEWIATAKEKGYTYHGGVTKKLSLLVCGDVNSTSSKAVKARKYGIEIMSYDDFMEVMR